MTAFHPHGPFPFFETDFDRDTNGWPKDLKWDYLKVCIAMFRAGGFLADDDVVLGHAMGLEMRGHWRVRVAKIRPKLTPFNPPQHLEKWGLKGGLKWVVKQGFCEGDLTQKRVLRDVAAAEARSDKATGARAARTDLVHSPKDPLPSPSPDIEVEDSDESSILKVVERLAMNGKDRIYPRLFEDFWKAYPVGPRDTKKNAYVEWRKVVTDGGETIERVLAGARSYKQYIDGCGGHPQRVQTWCRAEGWTASHAERGGTVAAPSGARRGHPSAIAAASAAMARGTGSGQD